MTAWNVVETFVSINGEGSKAGQLAVFVRFAGCNLACDYCDTKWANKPDVPYKRMDEHQIYALIKETGVRNVTLTGGEPLFRSEIDVLLSLLNSDETLDVEIETNGSIDLAPFFPVCSRIRFTMDYKLGASGMEHHMCLSNLERLRPIDTVKFVAGSLADLERAKEIIDAYRLIGRTHIYLSPVFSAIEPAAMVDFMKEHTMNGVNLQLQMHKFIWDPDKKGV